MLKNTDHFERYLKNAIIHSNISSQPVEISSINLMLSSNWKTGERDNVLSTFLEYTVSSIFMVSLIAVEI